MFKRLHLFVLSVALLGGLAACGTPSPQPTATPVPDTATPEPSATALPDTATPEPIETSEPAEAPTTTDAVRETDDGPTPTPPWQIPEIQPDDRVKGGSEAGLTVVEYSDFQ